MDPRGTPRPLEASSPIDANRPPANLHPAVLAAAAALRVVMDRVVTDAETGALREAESLVLAALALPRSTLYADPQRALSIDERERIAQWLARRCDGEPLAYLLGEREFWSLTLEVSPAVLVPRPETELLVERALQAGDALEATGIALPKVLDLGTGSGAIAIAIAHERPGWQITAVERSAAALVVAHRNATRHATANLELLAGDWYAPLGQRRFHVIASNPPYVACDDPHLAGNLLRHEPRAALTPGDDALADLRRLVEAAPRHLESGGSLLLEHGATQGAELRELLVARGFSHVVSHPDLAGHERVTEGQLPSVDAPGPHRSHRRREIFMLKFNTSAGDFTVELFAKESPESTANFLKYVDYGHYDGTIFHRVIPDFMIQGGGFASGMEQKDTRPPIRNEATNGMENLRGTLAMARTSDIHSATAQFFINLVDNDFLNHQPGNHGYAVFARVISGMDVVDVIAGVPTTRRRGHGDVPVDEVIVHSVTREAAN